MPTKGLKTRRTQILPWIRTRENLLATSFPNSGNITFDEFGYKKDGENSEEFSKTWLGHVNGPEIKVH